MSGARRRPRCQHVATTLALSLTGISPPAKAVSDAPVAYVLDIRQTQEGEARHFLVRCTDYQERACHGRITLSLDGHLRRGRRAHLP